MYNMKTLSRYKVAAKDLLVPALETELPFVCPCDTSSVNNPSDECKIQHSSTHSQLGYEEVPRVLTTGKCGYNHQATMRFHASRGSFEKFKLKPTYNCKYLP